MRVPSLAMGMLLLAAWPAAGHDSPGDVIHALNHQMETEGPTARLLAARAFEYQSLADWDAAVADFNQALALQPRYSAALAGLAAALLHQGDLDGAEAAARRSVALYDDATRQAAGHAMLARIFTARETWPEALTAWQCALRSPSPEVDWFLGEAECLARLGRYADQSAALATAKTRNPSGVLHRAWIRSLVDSGQLDEAAVEVERGLAESRWKSSWLLLRARIHARRGASALQQADAACALAELQGRLNSERPDAWLIAESGTALALMDEPEQARYRMKQARDLGMPDAGLRELDQLIAAAGPTAP